jgi:glycosyltransferase involved in cell wall biosynthesis
MIKADAQTCSPVGTQHAALGIVLPVLDEGTTILRTAQRVYDALVTSGLDFRLIFVADGSTDETPTLLGAFAKENARAQVLWEPGARGYGAAVRRGLAHLDTNVLGWTDGDDQVPPDAIVDLYRSMMETGAPFGSGIRSDREDGALRAVASWGYNALLRSALGLHHPDINAKPKLMTRELYERVRLMSDDWFIDTELIVHVKDLDAAMVRVPLVFHQRAGGKSKVETATIKEYVGNVRRLRRARRDAGGP